MKSMTVLCFVDANLFVYSVDTAQPLKRELAATLIERLWMEQRARTSIQVLNEFYVTVTRKLRRVLAPHDAWALVEEILEWEPQPNDAALIHSARSIESRHKLNWWDCLIVAAARLQHCTVLYTEDLQHGATLDGVKIVNPFIAQVQEDPAPYHASLLSPHRPRGRPRKQAAVG
jgi:predicted nucleic acid-binding protein